MGLEYYFKGWLERHESCYSERWDKLTVQERSILLEHYWQEWIQMHPEVKKLAEMNFDFGGNLIPEWELELNNDISVLDTKEHGTEEFVRFIVAKRMIAEREQRIAELEAIVTLIHSART